jgi:hypothetical protein
MRLEINELECLKDGETIRQKLGEVYQFFEEKGIAVEEGANFLNYDQGTLRLGLYITIPLHST